jgi:hypothetical protein
LEALLKENYDIDGNLVCEQLENYVKLEINAKIKRVDKNLADFLKLKLKKLGIQMNI